MGDGLEGTPFQSDRSQSLETSSRSKAHRRKQSKRESHSRHADEKDNSHQSRGKRKSCNNRSSRSRGYNSHDERRHSRRFSRHHYESEERDERSCGNILYNFVTMGRDKRIAPLITMITRKIITDPVEVEVTNKPLLIIRISRELSRLTIKVMITETTTPEISSPTITSHGTKTMVTTMETIVR